MAQFIVLEGLDGAGTTTQMPALVEALGPDSIRTAEPTDGPVGRIARSSLRGEPDAPPMAALPWLFSADRADHLHRLVEPSLAAGRNVVSDRYLPSSLAYQSLTLPLDEVWSLNRSFRVPDLTVYVRVDVKTALSRIGSRGGPVEIYDTEERLSQVFAAYERVMDFLRGEGWPVTTVDGSQPIDAVRTDILAALP